MEPTIAPSSTSSNLLTDNLEDIAITIANSIVKPTAKIKEAADCYSKVHSYSSLVLESVTYLV